MFTIDTDNPRVNRGKVKKLILEFGDVPNADIEYHEGYLDKDSKFVSLGVNKVHLEDKVQDASGPASTKFTDLMTRLNTSQDTDEEVKVFLIEQLPSCLQDVEETLAFEEAVIEEVLLDTPIAEIITEEEKTKTYLSLVDKIKTWLGITKVKEV